MAHYRKLLAWQAAHAMALCVYKVTDTWPDRERFGIISQLRRAAVSVPTNIVEGASRQGTKDYRKFLGYSLSSNSECEYLLLLASELGIATDADRHELEPLIKQSGRLVYGLIRSL